MGAGTPRLSACPRPPATSPQPVKATQPLSGTTARRGRDRKSNRKGASAARSRPGRLGFPRRPRHFGASPRTRRVLTESRSRVAGGGRTNSGDRSSARCWTRYNLEGLWRRGSDREEDIVLKKRELYDCKSACAYSEAL